GHLLSGHGPRSRCLAALCQSATYGAQGSRPVAWRSRAQERRLRSTAQITSQRRRSLTDKHLQCVEQRLRIILTLIDGRRHGAAVEQDMDRLPGRADGALDGEGYFSGHVDVLADESEIGRTLWNGGRHVAAAPGEPDVVDVGHVARHANR